MCAVGSPILQQALDVYICVKMSFLESYEASRRCVVTLNVFIITSNMACSEMEMAA